MDKTFIKRKNYVVDKSFQFRFIATFLAVILAALIVSSAFFAMLFWFQYMAGEKVFAEFITIHKQVVVEENGKPVLDAKGNKVTRSLELPPVNRIELVLPPLLFNNLIIMVLICIIGIFYSHRIAGPVYRIETDITRALEGEKGVKIRLRKNDKFTGLAEKVNALIEKLEQ